MSCTFLAVCMMKGRAWGPQPQPQTTTTTATATATTQAYDSSVPIFLWCLFKSNPSGRLMADRASGAAWRRRQRRLRSWWRHEQQTVAAVLAMVTHHSHSKVGTANAALRGQKIGTSTGVGPAEYFDLSSDDGRPTAGIHVGALAAGDGSETQWHRVRAGPGSRCSCAADGGTVAGCVLQFFATCQPVVAEQIVDVPKIILENIPSRRLCREPQLAEQLVEVPTILTPSFIRMLQNVDTPVPHVGRGASGGLQGFSPWT